MPRPTSFNAPPNEAVTSPFAPEVSGHAPGHPGISPSWSSSAKDVVGCSLDTARLWFTIGRGIVNEVYYPRVDIPQIRDLGFIVADDCGFWVEVKRLNRYTLNLPDAGIPAIEIVHRHARFTLRLRITCDSVRDVLLVEAGVDGDEKLRLYALLAPHLGGTGHDNIAEVADYGGRRVLWAQQGPFGLALAAAGPRQRCAWANGSAGYVGRSDGWQDFDRNGRMSWHYRKAGPGNVALTGELPHHTVLALGFGSSKESAATLALSALAQPFDTAWQRQIQQWTEWHRACAHRGYLGSGLPKALRSMVRTSAMVLRAHEDKTYAGATVASLSVPWGNTGDERGGYHLVWPRDLVETAGALLALGAEDRARNVLRYLIATQNADGHWHQNQWLGGKPYWNGVQLDEAAFPVLLAAMLGQRDALDGIEVGDMVRRALAFIGCNGPASDQDRWEEDSGVNAFTLAICIAALVAGSEFLDANAQSLALAIADYWNSRIEDWTVAHGTELARRVGVEAHYVRVAPRQAITDERAMHAAVPIKNHAQAHPMPAEDQVGVDFLQLVRFGLRRADDALVQDSIKIVDAVLRVDTPNGACWHRYNGDGYGEHDDGSAFNGTGRGRAWPLLTGERGHYELQAGRSALPQLQAMAAMTSAGGMIPEQVWDDVPIASRALTPGHPTGSAMPLAWAHSEFIKLAASVQRGHPFDRPHALWERYHGIRPNVAHAIWTEQAPISRIAVGTSLLVCLRDPGTLHWGPDGWQEVHDTSTRDSALGLHVCRIDTGGFEVGQRIDLTFRSDSKGWRGIDYRIQVVAAR